MKKSLFILMAIAMVFVGCKKTEEKKADQAATQALEINKHELLMTLDEEEILEEINGQSVSWRSTNPEVATVRAGLVTSVGLGRTFVIAEANGIADTCLVLVKEELAFIESFEPGGYGVFGLDPLEGADTSDVEMMSGDVYRCVLRDATIYLWDKTISLNNKRLSGSGLIFMIPGYLYEIVEGDYAGYYVGSSRGFFVEPADSVKHGRVVEGTISADYAENAVDYFLKAWNASEEDYDSLAAVAARDAYDASFSGGVMLQFEEGFYYPYLALLTAGGRFNEDENDEFIYDIDVDWFDFDDYAQFGVRGQYITDEAGDTVAWAFDEPLQLSMTSKNYSNHDFAADDQEEEEAPKYKIINPARIHEGVDPIKNWKRVDLKALRTK